MDTSTGWGRGVIRGVANYGLKQGLWHLSVDEYGVNEAQHLRRGWEGDGIIARVTDKDLFDELKHTGKPIVNVSGIQIEGVELPTVTTDYEAIAQIAVQHFSERGFRHLAYCGPDERAYVKRHCDAFVDRAVAEGLDCSVFHSKSKGRKRSWEAERAELRDWLESLPKPLGILAWATRRGRDLLAACDELGLRVPEEVALLGGDNDDLLCEVCQPPLSAVITPAEQIGHEAARMLDGLLQGKSSALTPSLFPPVGIHLRQSTETLAIDDALLGEAIAFIRENANRPLQVTDVAEEVGISRRALERRFIGTVGRSPAREIQHAHLLRAQKLLRETDMSVADIAAASGYGSTEYMIGVFRKITGRTPLKYRSWIRAT